VTGLLRVANDDLISALNLVERRAAELASAVAEFGIQPDVAETAEAYGRAAVHVERILTKTSPPMHVLRTTLHASDVQRLIRDPRRVVWCNVADGGLSFAYASEPRPKGVLVLSREQVDALVADGEGGEQSGR